MIIKKTKSNYPAGLIFLAVFAAGVWFALVDKPGQGSDEPMKECVDLNTTLSNSMSDCDSLMSLDKDVKEYMRCWSIAGAGLAIMRNDSLLYCKGYGMEDDSLGVEMRPGSLMRIASVSKLLTSVGIMLLVERDSIALDDKVFGEDGLLAAYDERVRDKRYRDFTVEQLLRHESGLSCRRGDPLFAGVHFNDRDELLDYAFRRYIAFKPGTGSEYSNFGYLLLSMIIEEVTGENYEKWMNENVLQPAGCRDMHIGFDSYEERFEGECRYHGSSINSVRLLSGAGAWVCSVAELARFISAIDSLPGVRDIISTESFSRMTIPTDSVRYGIGWTDIKPSGEMTRTGTLASTTALIKCYPDNECWIFVTNTGSWKGPRFSKYTSYFLRKSREKYSSVLPERDLFYL